MYIFALPRSHIFCLYIYMYRQFTCIGKYTYRHCIYGVIFLFAHIGIGIGFIFWFNSFESIYFDLFNIVLY